MARKRIPPRCGIPGWRWVVRGRVLVLCDPEGFAHDAVGPRERGAWLVHSWRFLIFRHRREAMDYVENANKIKWGIGVVIERLANRAEQVVVLHEADRMFPRR